jgi:hypothetical protein
MVEVLACTSSGIFHKLKLLFYEYSKRSPFVCYPVVLDLNIKRHCVQVALRYLFMSSWLK